MSRTRNTLTIIPKLIFREYEVVHTTFDAITAFSTSNSKHNAVAVQD